jgi:hypothetical protein
MPSSNLYVSFIFPKEFEFFKFLSFGLKEEKIVAMDECEGRFHLELALPANEFVFQKERQDGKEEYHYHSVHCYVPQESDIGFHHLFHRILQEHHDEHDSGAERLIVLIGSCGSTDDKDLGKLFHVKEATKLDRGRTSVDNTFSPRADKLLTERHELGTTLQLLFGSLEERRTFSVNFLNEAQVVVAVDEREEQPSWNKEYAGLYDMETYEFFQLCRSNDIKYFTCLRFVTDKVSTFPAGKPDHFESASTLNLQLYWNYFFQDASQQVNPVVEDALRTLVADPNNQKLGSAQFAKLTHLKKYLRISQHSFGWEGVWDLPFALMGQEYGHPKNMLQVYVTILTKRYRKSLSDCLSKLLKGKDEELLKKVKDEVEKRAGKTQELAISAVVDWQDMMSNLPLLTNSSDDEESNSDNEESTTVRVRSSKKY